MTTDARCHASDTAQDELARLYGTSGLSWRAIAALPEYSGIPAGTLCAISKGAKIPIRYRTRFGLPSMITVTPVNGSTIPPGSQVHHADLCVECGKPYISNHPLRRRCFICGKYRGKTP